MKEIKTKERLIYETKLSLIDLLKVCLNRPVNIFSDYNIFMVTVENM